jgi:hypothetical protein
LFELGESLGYGGAWGRQQQTYLVTHGLDDIVELLVP